MTTSQIDAVIQFTKKELLKTGFTGMTVYGFAGEDENVLFIPGLFSDEEGQKEAFYDTVKGVFATYGVDRYIVTMKAWMTKKADVYGRPSHDPNKVEILAVSEVTRHSREMRIFEIIRDKDQKIKGIKEMPEYSGLPFEGLAAELLPDENTELSPEQKKATVYFMDQYVSKKNLKH